MSTVRVDVPKAFSVRDDHEFVAHSHLVARMNPKLKIKPVAMGLHVNGGPTVFWGLVYHADHEPSEEEVKQALIEAGCDNGRRQTMTFSQSENARAGMSRSEA